MRRLLRLLACLLLLVGGLAAGCTSAPPVHLAQRLPAALLDRGAVWEGPEPVEPDGRSDLAGLLSLLDLSEADLRATLVTGAPSVILLDHPGAGGVAEVLVAAGMAAAEAPSGWQLHVRGEQTPTTVGVPAVGTAEDLVVVGDEGEVRAVMAAEPDDRIPVSLLDGAQIALVGTPETAAAAVRMSVAGELADYEVFVVTATAQGAGVAAIVRSGADQDDAVRLAVRLATAVDPDGTAIGTLVRPDEPLTSDDIAAVDLEWLVDPPGLALSQGADTGLAGSLRVGEGGF